MSKIILRGIGDNEISVIKDIRDLLNVDLNQAREVAEIVKKGDELELMVDDVQFALNVLKASGADVCICDDIEAQDDNEMNEQFLNGSLLQNLYKCKEIFQKGVELYTEKEKDEKDLETCREHCDTFKSPIIYFFFSGVFTYGANVFLYTCGVITDENIISYLVGIFAACIGLYFVLLRHFIIKIADSKYGSKIAMLEQSTIEKQNAYETFTVSLEAKNCYEFMTGKYWNQNAIDGFISIIESKRADSFKEAANIYENSLHQERMEEMQREQLAYSKETVERMSSLQATTERMEKHAANTERYAKSAAHSAKVGNVIGAVNTVQLHNVSKHTKK